MLLDLTLTDDEDAASTVGQETGVPFSHKLAINLHRRMNCGTSSSPFVSYEKDAFRLGSVNRFTGKSQILN